MTAKKLKLKKYKILKMYSDLNKTINMTKINIKDEL